MFIVYFCGCSVGFDFVFQILVKRWARKSISEMAHFVSSAGAREHNGMAGMADAIPMISLVW